MADEEKFSEGKPEEEKKLSLEERQIKALEELSQSVEAGARSISGVLLAIGLTLYFGVFCSGSASGATPYTDTDPASAATQEGQRPKLTAAYTLQP